MSEKYPSWIDEYARSIHKAFTHMTPADWGPLDFYAGFKALNGTFLERLHQAVSRLKKAGVSPEEAVACFKSPSGFRALVYFAILEYQWSDHAQRAQARTTFDYLVNVLECMFKRDIWAYEHNIVHTDEDIARIAKQMQWQDGSSEAAKAIARLGNAASALSYALYRDFYVAESQEVYAPYDVSDHFGPDHVLVIKHYPKMRPVELWSGMRDFAHTDMKIYFVYEHVGVTCEFIGMHTLYEGDLMAGLRKWAVEIDGAFYSDLGLIKQKTEYVGNAVVDFWPVYETMSKEQLKMKFLEWMGFAFADFFKRAEMDWRPTEKMISAIMSKNIPDRLIMPGMPPYEEYVNSKEWEVHWLRDLYST